MRLGKPISILTGPYNQDGTKEIETILGKKVFNNPKLKELIKYLLSFVFDGKDDKDGIYLDSFGGSGTTAHAVLDLNRDGGNRKYILLNTLIGRMLLDLAGFYFHSDLNRQWICFP